MRAPTRFGKVCTKHPELVGELASNGSCKACHYAYVNEWKAANRQAVAAQGREYRTANQDAVATGKKAYYEAHKEALTQKMRDGYAANKSGFSEVSRAYYRTNATPIKARAKEAYYRDIEASRAKGRLASKRYAKANRAVKNAAYSAYRSSKLKATPHWANAFFIREAYSLAKLREKVCGGKWHVDHIVPLKSEKVCGLHCEANLQVIPAQANHTKNNKYWPEMP